jgi:hypothetical protein
VPGAAKFMPNAGKYVPGAASRGLHERSQREKSAAMKMFVKQSLKERGRGFREKVCVPVMLVEAGQVFFPTLTARPVD